MEKGHVEVEGHGGDEGDVDEGEVGVVSGGCQEADLDDDSGVE